MNYEEPIAKPSLIEPGVKYFLSETLKNCHELKEKYYNYIFNIGMFLLFVTILAGILVYKYKGKLTPQEEKERDLQKKQYILSKIKNYNDEKKRMQQELITGLPSFDKF